LEPTPRIAFVSGTNNIARFHSLRFLYFIVAPGASRSVQMLIYDEDMQQLKTPDGSGMCNSQCVSVSVPDAGVVLEGEQSCSSTAALTLLGGKDDEEDSYAASLDGSPFGIYLVKSVSGSDRWTVYFEGGGWCMTESECLVRTEGGNGSSDKLPKTRNCQCYNSEDGSLYQDCNCLYLPYMDGASFSGFAKDPVSVLNETSGEYEDLYFRGIKNLDAALIYALDEGLRDASEVVVSGGSAGGLSTMLHADRVSDFVKRNSALGDDAVVFAAPDVGYVGRASEASDVDYNCLYASLLIVRSA